MTYEEFLKIAEESLKGLSSYASSYDTEDGFYIRNDTLYQKHVSGGASGGNCWGDSPQSFYNETPAQEFLPLDKILTEVAPNISYLKYREIQKIIESDTDSDYEYYGNYTNYDIYKLDLEKLYDMIFNS